MANNQWDREVINVRERPLSSDINQAQSQLDRTTREVLSALFRSRVSPASDLSGNPISGFIGDGLKVREPTVPGLSVKISAGLGFQYLPADVPSAIGGVVGLDDLSTYKPLPLTTAVTISGITAGPIAGQDRYDIVEVRLNRVLGNPLSRDTLDTISGVFVSGNVNKSLAFTLDGSTGVVTSPASSSAAISYKVGVAAATGGAVEPPTTAGYEKIATIFSNNGNMTVGVTRSHIIDRRRMLAPGNVQPFSLKVSVPSGAAAPPTFLHSNLPPGVEAVCRKLTPPSQNYIGIYLLGGFLDASSTIAATATISTAALTSNIYTAQGGGAISTTGLTSGDVTALADATKSFPALAFPQGHPYALASFWCLHQAAGVTDTAVPDPMIIDVVGTLLR